MEAPRTNSTVLSTSPFLTTAESSVPLDRLARQARAATRGERERSRVSRSLSRDALSRLDRDLKALNDNVLRASTTATAALVQHAQELPDPVRRRHVQPCRSKSQQRADVMLYEYERPSSDNDHTDDDDDDDEGEAAVDDDIVLAKPKRRHVAAKASSSSSLSVPRVAAYVIIQATVDAFEATFTQTAAARLNEDMAYTELLYTLCEEPHKRISIERMVLQPRGVSATTRYRDFVVVACQKRFKLPDGRQGWVHSVQSVDVPIQHHSGLDRVCVRGMLRRSGVVAIESPVHKNSLDVVVTAQLDMRGSASQGTHRAVSKRRCLKVMDALKDALVRRRVETMSFPGTYRFLEIAFEQKASQCAICQDKLWRCRVPGWKAARFTCRKCGGSVCGACSHVWEIERTRETVLVGGGRVTTPTRVCNQCFTQPHASGAAPGPSSVDKKALRKSPPAALLRPQQHQNFRHTPPQSEHSDRGTSIFANSHIKPRRASAVTTSTNAEPLRPTQLEFHLPSDRSFSLSDRSFTLAPPSEYEAPPPPLAFSIIDELDDEQTRRLDDVDPFCASMKTIRLDWREP